MWMISSNCRTRAVFSASGFDFCHFQENGNSENTVKMGKRTFLKPRPNARVFKTSRPRIERRNFGAVKTGNFRILGFCQKGQKSSLERFPRHECEGLWHGGLNINLGNVVQALMDAIGLNAVQAWAYANSL